MSDHRQRALVVAYAFPPVGGAGVQRVSKLAKYLPLHGFTPQVLTVANPSVPLTDESLARDLPADLEIIRARSLEPGYAAKKVAWRHGMGSEHGAHTGARGVLDASNSRERTPPVK